MTHTQVNRQSLSLPFWPVPDTSKHHHYLVTAGNTHSVTKGVSSPLLPAYQSLLVARCCSGRIGSLPLPLQQQPQPHAGCSTASVVAQQQQSRCVSCEVCCRCSCKNCSLQQVVRPGTGYHACCLCCCSTGAAAAVAASSGLPWERTAAVLTLPQGRCQPKQGWHPEGAPQPWLGSLYSSRLTVHKCNASKRANHGKQLT